MTPTSSNSTDPVAPSVPRSLFFACYAILGALLVYALIARWFLPLCVDEPIGIQRAGSAALSGSDTTATSPVVFDDRVDPNTADWPELTRLPEIGEVTAKRIVAYREEHRRDQGGPVFRSAKDLSRVRGIGPKTVQAIEPHLRFDDE